MTFEVSGVSPAYLSLVVVLRLVLVVLMLSCLVLLFFASSSKHAFVALCLLYVPSARSSLFFPFPKHVLYTSFVWQ